MRMENKFNLQNNINPEASSFLKRPEGGKEEFREITQNPQRQYLSTSLVRGVINAAQVIEEHDINDKGEIINKKYFSHYQNINSLEKKLNPELAYIEFKADQLILDEVFQSRDHEIYDPKNSQKDPKNQIEHTNVIVNTLPEEENQPLHSKIKFDKYYLFDFGRVFMPIAIKWEDNHDSIMIEDNKKKFIRNIETLNQVSPWNDKDSGFNILLDLLKTKSTSLLQTSFKDFDVFNNILMKGGVDLTSKEFEVYFKYNFVNQKMETQDERAHLMFNELKTRLELLNKAVS